MSMMEELNFFFGVQIQKTSDGIFIIQTKCLLKLIKKFGLENAKESKIPMSTTWELDNYKEGIPVDQRLYKSMIRILLCLTTSRTNIMLSVCLCVRFQASPKETL